ncbi:MAG: bifunctional transcriptional activator/DNA repair enzyme AdaA [Acidiferrobacterales bacterium]
MTLELIMTTRKNATPSNKALDILLAQSRDYDRIVQALEYVAQHASEQPDLADIASEVGLSEYHFQRLFSRWVGISPKKFLQYLTLSRAKQSLSDSASVLDATYDAGLSSPSRLHDLFVRCEAVTPGEYKRRGQDLTIQYGFHPTPFGECLLMLTERGICGLAFVMEGDREGALAHQLTGWEQAQTVSDQDGTRGAVERIFASHNQPPVPGTSPLRLLLRGTPFQVKVWEALLRVPAGSLTTYESLAHLAGYRGNAARAVGQAIGHNLIAYLIPCHRVIRKTGVIGNYRWGQTRKRALIGWEAARGELGAV